MNASPVTWFAVDRPVEGTVFVKPAGDDDVSPNDEGVSAGH